MSTSESLTCNASESLMDVIVGTEKVKNGFGFTIGPRFGSDYYALNVTVIAACCISLNLSVGLLMCFRQRLFYYNQQLTDYYSAQKQQKSTKKRDEIPIPKIHIPYISWIVAIFIFTIFWIVSFALGTVHEIYYLIFIAKDVTNGYSKNMVFIVWSIANIFLEFALYWLVWTQWTIEF